MEMSKASARKSPERYPANVGGVAEALTRTYHDFDHHNLRDDPFGELLFILCSVRTHAAGYTATYEALRKEFATPEALVAATVPELTRVLHGGGLAEHKALSIRAALDGIKAQFGELTLEPLRKWDDAACEEFLTGLPFVGKKVARCVMMYSLGRQVFPVDLHCWRICQRLGWVRPTRPDGTCSQKDMERAQSKIPPEHRFSLHVNMVSHGRVCCTPTTPACPECPVNDLCPKVGVRRSRKKVLPVPADAMGKRPSSKSGKASTCRMGNAQTGAAARSSQKRQKRLEPFGG